MHKPPIAILSTSITVTHQFPVRQVGDDIICGTPGCGACGADVCAIVQIEIIGNPAGHGIDTLADRSADDVPM